MQTWTHDPTFRAYALSMIVLCGNLLYLWARSGALRGRSKTVMNPEDLGTVARGATLVPTDPPEVARVLRAHGNAMALTVPFALLGLLYVMAGGPALPAQLGFGAFVATRIAHAYAYLHELQPWRTISFAVSGVVALALLGHVTWLVAFA